MGVKGWRHVCPGYVVEPGWQGVPPPPFIGRSMWNQRLSGVSRGQVTDNKSLAGMILKNSELAGLPGHGLVKLAKQMWLILH